MLDRTQAFSFQRLSRAHVCHGDIVHILKLFCQLPPPLSYLCELSILPHLNELPLSSFLPGWLDSLRSGLSWRQW